MKANWNELSYDVVDSRKGKENRILQIVSWAQWLVKIWNEMKNVFLYGDEI